MPRVRLVQVSGVDLGVHRFAVADWKVGDEILLGGVSLRVFAVQWHDEHDEIAATLTVVAEGLVPARAVQGAAAAVGCLWLNW